MESMLEILIWIVIVMLLFYVCNTVWFVRTAASLFISFLMASAFIYLIYRSLFGEIVLMLSFTIGMIYAIFRAVRDKRDDLPSRTSHVADSPGPNGTAADRTEKVRPFSPMGF